MMRGGGRERIYIDEEVEEGLWYFEQRRNDGHDDSLENA